MSNTNPEIVNRTPISGCPACDGRRIHSEDDWKFHLYNRHGFVRERGWTHPDLATADEIRREGK